MLPYAKGPLVFVVATVQCLILSAAASACVGKVCFEEPQDLVSFVQMKTSLKSRFVFDEDTMQAESDPEESAMQDPEDGPSAIADPEDGPIADPEDGPMGDPEDAQPAPEAMVQDPEDAALLDDEALPDDDGPATAATENVAEDNSDKESKTESENGPSEATDSDGFAYVSSDGGKTSPKKARAGRKMFVSPADLHAQGATATLTQVKIAAVEKTVADQMNKLRKAQGITVAAEMDAPAKHDEDTSTQPKASYETVTEETGMEQTATKSGADSSTSLEAKVKDAIAAQKAATTTEVQASEVSEVVNAIAAKRTAAAKEVQEAVQEVANRKLRKAVQLTADTMASKAAAERSALADKFIAANLAMADKFTAAMAAEKKAAPKRAPAAASRNINAATNKKISQKIHEAINAAKRKTQPMQMMSNRAKGQVPAHALEVVAVDRAAQKVKAAQDEFNAAAMQVEAAQKARHVATAKYEAAFEPTLRKMIQEPESLVNNPPAEIFEPPHELVANGFANLNVGVAQKAYKSAGSALLAAQKASDAATAAYEKALEAPARLTPPRQMMQSPVETLAVNNMPAEITVVPESHVEEAEKTSETVSSPLASYRDAAVQSLQKVSKMYAASPTPKPAVRQMSEVPVDLVAKQAVAQQIAAKDNNGREVLQLRSAATLVEKTRVAYEAAAEKVLVARKEVAHWRDVAGKNTVFDDETAGFKGLLESKLAAKVAAANKAAVEEKALEQEFMKAMAAETAAASKALAVEAAAKDAKAAKTAFHAAADKADEAHKALARAKALADKAASKKSLAGPKAAADKIHPDQAAGEAKGNAAYAAAANKVREVQEMVAGKVGIANGVIARSKNDVKESIAAAISDAVQKVESDSSSAQSKGANTAKLLSNGVVAQQTQIANEASTSAAKEAAPKAASDKAAANVQHGIDLQYMTSAQINAARLLEAQQQAANQLGVTSGAVAQKTQVANAASADATRVAAQKAASDKIAADVQSGINLQYMTSAQINAANLLKAQKLAADQAVAQQLQAATVANVAQAQTDVQTQINEGINRQFQTTWR